jgi:hypothetical protein
MLAARRDRVGAVGDECVGLAAGDELAVDVAAAEPGPAVPLDSMRSNIVKA